MMSKLTNPTSKSMSTLKLTTDYQPGDTPMKLKTLAPVALILLSGAAMAQDAATKPTTPSPAPAAQSQSRDQYNTKAAQGTAQSQANAQGGAHANFSTADTNKDGKLSLAELKVVMPDVMIKDTDNDGFVSQMEAQTSISGLALEDYDAEGDIGADQYDAIVAYAGKPGAAGAGAGANAGRGNTTPRSGTGAPAPAPAPEGDRE
jgi:hypothetical protein